MSDGDLGLIVAEAQFNAPAHLGNRLYEPGSRLLFDRDGLPQRAGAKSQLQVACVSPLNRRAQFKYEAH